MSEVPPLTQTPHAYLKDVMDKLPSWPNSRVLELLPHRWQPASA